MTRAPTWAYSAAASALAGALPDEVRAALSAAPGPGPAPTTPGQARALVLLGLRGLGMANNRLSRLNGTVIADSAAEAAAMENHASRPEFAEALAGRAALARRRSSTLGAELLYAAVPLYARTEGQGRIVGALRVAVDLPALDARLEASRSLLAAAMLLVFGAALTAALFLSRRIALPLKALAEASRELAAGRPGARLLQPREGPEELRLLAEALDAMSVELERRLREAEREGREKAAILDGMSEAVLALDAGMRLRMANPAARSLFGFTSASVVEGLPLLTATRSTELEEAVESCLSSARELETEIPLYAESERWFQVLVAPLGRAKAEAEGKGGGSEPGGAVLVLNDITRLRRLERVRRDFVANVSHELRTPIQLIKGFIETLLEEGVEEVEQRKRFLGIMRKNADRMENLIGDLLALARLEQEDSSWLKRENLAIGSLVEEAFEAVAMRAEEKSIRLGADCEEGLEAFLNGGLFVQALVNLLDNAVKYSPAASNVTLSARRDGDSLLVTVSDHGMGIPAKDLPRLFERFYRVDKARSTALGGTGLGLAIVKHIALAHGGGVMVESYEGEGSRFMLRFPLAPKA